MRHSIAFAATALALLPGAAGCQRTATAPSDDSDTSTESDTGAAPCPYDCIYPSVCQAVNGEAHSDLDCDELGTICCDLSDADTETAADADTDTDTDSDTDSDSDTETVLEPCPYECMNELLCEQLDGLVHDGYEPCANPSHVCCEAGADTDTDSDTGTDTGLPLCPYECMTEVLCALLEGTVHAEYDCAGDMICCETPPDTD